MATKTLSVVITGESSGAQRAFQQTSRASDDLASKIETAGKKMASVGKSLTLGVTAPVAAFAALGFSELSEAGKVAAQTEAAIRSTGGAANVTARQVQNLAGALMEKSGIDDEAIQSGENLLLTFTRVRNEAGKGNDIFNQATKAALDLSVAFGKDMSDSAILVGKALNDPIRGVTALTRVGVTFTQAQRDQIAALVEAGDVMGAQKIILRELRTEVGGSAEAYGKTMAGQISRAREELNNAAGAMVAVAAPAITVLGKALSGVAGFLNDLSPGAKTAVGAFAAVAASIGPVLFVGGKLMQTAKSISSAWSTLSDAFALAQRGIANFTSAVSMADKATLLAGFGVSALVAGIGTLIVALASTDGPYERAVRSAEKWGRAQINAAKSSGDEFRALMSTSRALQSNIDDLRAAQKFYSDAITEGQPGAQGYRKNLDEVSQQLLVAEQRHKALQPELQRLRAEMEAAKAEEQARKVAVDALASGTQNLATTTDAGRKAIQDFQNALLAAAGGPIAYQQALQNQANAQQALNDAIAQYGPDSVQAQQASLALQQAHLGVASAANQMDQAQANLTQQLFKGNTTYQEQLKLLYQQLVAHPENAAGIELEKQALDRAKAAADAMPGSKTITVDADTSQAHQKISDLELAAIGLTREEYRIMINVGGDALGYLVTSDRNVKRDIRPVVWA